VKRIVLSILAIGCAFCVSLGCVDTGAVADDQPADIAPDAAVASVGPIWWPWPWPQPIPDCPACDPWPDPPPEKLDTPDAAVDEGIGTSPVPADVWWRPWCPPYCVPGPTDTTGIVGDGA
jgi:hypothetical protein